jgi:hypothetical protein
MSKCINTMRNIHPEENMFNKIDDRTVISFYKIAISCYNRLKGDHENEVSIILYEFWFESVES